MGMENSFLEGIVNIYFKIVFTMWLIQIFINVKNRVAKKPILPGIDEGGIMKLIWDRRTMAAPGK